MPLRWMVAPSRLTPHSLSPYSYSLNHHASRLTTLYSLLTTPASLLCSPHLSLLAPILTAHQSQHVTDSYCSGWSAYGCYPRGSTGTHQCCWMERWGSCASLRPGGTQQGSGLIILIIPHGRSRGAPAKTIVNSSCSDIGGAPGGHPARPSCCFYYSFGGGTGGTPTQKHM